MDKELRDELNALRAENQKLKEQVEIYKDKFNRFRCDIKIENREPIETEDKNIAKGNRFHYRESMAYNKFYKNIFVNNTSIMLIIDPYTGNIIDANHTALIFYGYTKSQLTQMNIGDMNILSKEEISKRIKYALQKKQSKFIFKHRVSSGEIKDVEITSSPIEINDKWYLHTIVHDITEKAKKLELLDQNEKKFEQLFNNINDALFVFQLNEEGIPGKFLEVNETACNRLGYTYEELLNMTSLDVDNTDRDYLTKIFKKVQKTNKFPIGSLQTEHITKDGRVIPVEVNTHIFDLDGEHCILAVARDITSRKEIEKDLRYSIEKQEKIMSFLPDAVLILQGKKIVFINEYGSNMLGYESTTSLIGKDYLSIVHPNFHNKVIGRMKSMEEKNTIAPLVEEKFIKVNGISLDVEVTGLKIPYEDNSAFLMVARDITQRKKVKNQLDEKIEFEKLRTEFFANISHELRTPLNVILGSLQLLNLYDQEGDSDNKTVNYIKVHSKMKQNCYRLLRLVNNIIDITKIDAGFYNIVPQNCDIVGLIKNIVFSVEDYVKNRGLSIKFETTLEEAIIACDPEKIERILLNLLSNAIKFTEENGSINVTIKRNLEQLIITVEDTGIGIPQESLSDLFNRFTQVDKSLTRNHEGSGIGLSLVESLVRLHQGKITVESEINSGSIFTITLPNRKTDQPTENSKNDYCGELNIERMQIEFSDIYNIIP